MKMLTHTPWLRVHVNLIIVTSYLQAWWTVELTLHQISSKPNVIYNDLEILNTNHSFIKYELKTQPPKPSGHFIPLYDIHVIAII